MVSVDTYLRRKDTSNYEIVEGEGIQVLVSPILAEQASRIHVDLQKFLFWKSFAVYAET